MRPYQYGPAPQTEFKPKTVEIIRTVAAAAKLNWQPGGGTNCLKCHPCCADWLPALEKVLKEHSLLESFVETPLPFLGDTQNFELQNGRLVVKSDECFDLNKLASAVDTLV